MSRQLKSLKGEQVLLVEERIILNNYWEYFVLAAKTNTDDTKLCLVMGDVCEIGDVWLPEIEPYILVGTKDLAQIKPPEGYQWIN